MKNKDNNIQTDTTSVGLLRKASDYEYYAFISYKHEYHGQFSEDAKWASAIDKELRNLHIPTEKVDIEELISEIDDSVDPVFRDTSNLPITHKGELENHLKESLKASKTLVLILSKEMVEDQNQRYDKDPRKSQAWIYWEVKTFLACHGKDWSKVIPVYIDADDYDAGNINSAIGIENHFENIVKPWHDYHEEEKDWNTERKYFHERTAADIACSIFNVKDKGAFWNIKKKANEAKENERKKNRMQKWLLAAGIFFISLIAVTIVILFFYTKSKEEVTQSRIALERGNRKAAIEYARAAHRHRRKNQEALETMWAATDSTRAFFTVDSQVSFDAKDSLLAYVDRNKYIVVAETKTFNEVERLDAGQVYQAFISPDGGQVAAYGKDHYLRIFNRNTQEWHDKGQVWSTVRWNDVGSILVVGSKVFLEEGVFTLVEKTKSGAISISYSSASFMGRDSLLAVVSSVIGREKRPPRLLVYNLKRGEKNKYNGDWILPSDELEIGADLIDARIEENGNSIIGFSPDSIYTYSVQTQDNNLTLKPIYRDPVQTPLQRVVFNNDQRSAFVVDSSAKASTYYYTGSRLPRQSFPDIRTLETKSPSLIPICSVNEDRVLYYLGSGLDINLSDGNNLGLHLPAVSDDAEIKGLQHKDFVTVEVSDRGIRYKTYLFYPGDGRMKSPKWCYRVLSSDYVISAGMDLFIKTSPDGKSTTRSSSYCLYDVETGNHLMHLSQAADMEYGSVQMDDCCYADNLLAVRFRKKEGGYLLRLYNLLKREMIYELSLEGSPWSLYWMNGKTLVYALDGNLYRLCVDAEDLSPEIVATDVQYILTSLRTPETLLYMSANNRERWYSVSDNTVRDREDNLSPNGQYYVKRSNINHAPGLFVLDARTLDTLSLRIMKTGGSSFGKFSKDGKLYFYSDGKDKLCCMKLPDGKLQWSLPIWEPLSLVAGKKYAVVLSTSLYVLNVKTGSIVCEFETDMASNTKITLSPDEKWIIAGDKLYSIPYKQLMATGVDMDFLAIEENYLIYRNKLMKLPNFKTMFE